MLPDALAGTCLLLVHLTIKTRPCSWLRMSQDVSQRRSILSTASSFLFTSPPSWLLSEHIYTISMNPSVQTKISYLSSSLFIFFTWNTYCKRWTWLRVTCQLILPDNNCSYTGHYICDMSLSSFLFSFFFFFLSIQPSNVDLLASCSMLNFLRSLLLSLSRPSTYLANLLEQKLRNIGQEQTLIFKRAYDGIEVCRDWLEISCEYWVLLHIGGKDLHCMMCVEWFS